MKKQLLSTIFMAIGLASFAQQTTPADALRLAITDLNGTARFRGMSGAFGAVGGDLSAININPAGSAIFSHNSGTGTVGLFNTKNNSNYFGTSSSDSESIFDINQLGAVFVFNDNSQKTDWKKIAVAINYEMNNNFDNSFYSRGTNPDTSIGNYFLGFANGANSGNAIPVELVETQPGETISELYSYLATLPNGSYPNINGFNAQQAMLGYQAFLYDYDNVNNIYTSNIPPGTFYQENNVMTTGYNGKITANVATQYNDKLYLGINLNAHFTDFRKSSSVYERNTNNPALGVQEIQFDNELYTYGGGFSFNLGLIANLTKEFRAGLAYESPTWYRLNDELSQRLIAVSTDGTDVYTDAADPGVINIYEPYKIQTPGKFTGSLAYIFGKNGLISFDYAVKDYSNTQFRPKREQAFRDLNSLMSDQLTTASEYRIGAEYRIKQASLRAGYRYEESPYKNGRTIGDLTGYTAGLGYNFKGSRLDLAYSFSKRDSEMQFVSSGMTDAAKISSKNNNILVSYTIDF
ncbi:outer membrane protein transport protein [Flavobacterium sp.]|uniref:OmpP1/FadL family transporter n=1 Tax=Flavobacterium sp. TaxID=239 RepID=UPI0028BE88F9|nr:outer membrane protein transport protein [Flavobacterium sp.]